MPPAAAFSVLSNVFLLCCSNSNDSYSASNTTAIINVNTTKPNLENGAVIQFANTVGIDRPIVETRIPSWIAAPLIRNRKKPSTAAQGSINNVRMTVPSSVPVPVPVAVPVSNIDININFPFTDELFKTDNVNPDVVQINRTVFRGSNILQINIFNNGAPIIRPTIIAKPGPTNDTIRISLSAGGIETTVNPEEMTAAEEVPLLPWWKTSVIYQIYPRSFKDSDGSGTGDLKGITSKLDYLKDLGVGTIWISPFYVSPMADFGYDVADFKDVDPIFGTLEDFDEMLNEIHKRGLKLIMDFVPNHTSDEHDWFLKSEQRIEPYTDYYMWVKPKGFNETGSPIPPNNWISVFGFSAWEWSPIREEFYLHQFLKEQPDLNPRNPLVMEELDLILKYWLDKGVDGFRIDALKHLYEVENLQTDEPLSQSPEASSDPNQYSYHDHIYSTNQPETIEAVRRWRKIFDQYQDKLMVVEVYDQDLKNILIYYGNSTDKLAHFPFNFYFITELKNRSSVTGTNLKRIIDIWMQNMPEGAWPNFVLGNHDRGRIASRLGEDLIDSLNMMTLLLPGTPTTYYGEEIGMRDTSISYEQAQDPFGLNFGPERYKEFGRDPPRTPMQWDSTTSAGFSSNATTWLPVNANYDAINVDVQKRTNQSTLKIYKSLTELRKNKVFTHGSITFPIVSEDILAFKRSFRNESSYLVVINTSKMTKELNQLIENSKDNSITTGEILIRSSTDDRKETTPGMIVNLASLSLLGGEGIVLKI